MTPPLLDVLASDDEEQGTDRDPSSVIGAEFTPPGLSQGSEWVPKPLERVDVFSVGWYQQGCKYKPNLELMLPSIELMLKVRFNATLGVCPRLYMDTQKFYQAPPGTGHVGMNEKDIHIFIKNRHFKPWLSEVLHWVKSLALAQETERAVIVCVCKAGRNRSVCAKTILNFVLNEFGYVTNSEDGHLSNQGWWRVRDICWSCDGCKKMTHWKLQSLNKAFRVWCSL